MDRAIQKNSLATDSKISNARLSQMHRGPQSFGTQSKCSKVVCNGTSGALARPLERAPARIATEPSLTVGLIHRQHTTTESRAPGLRLVIAWQLRCALRAERIFEFFR